MQRLKPILDPRTKMVMALSAIVLIAGTGSFRVLAAVEIILIAAILRFAAIDRFARWLLLTAPMAIIFAAVSAWSFTIAVGVLAGLKLMALTTVGFLFFIRTPPEDLANALVKTGIPFTIAFVMSAGMQFVPIMTRKARNVMDAQKVRGIPLKPGWRTLRQYGAFLMPLLVQAFQMAEELAEAMETRGFGRPGRSFYKQFKLTGWDYAVMAVSVATAVAVSWGLRMWS